MNPFLLLFRESERFLMLISVLFIGVCVYADGGKD